jgi:hypothetical protein
MKIGIELNNIVRDLNKQIIKYYKKDINQSFDDKNVNYNVTNIIDSIDFKSKKAKFEYMYVDYPYEIFGCAPTTHRNLAVTINNWLISLGNKEDDRYDVKLFSLKEEALSIQSTYYFLSKIGCRVREMFFPKDGVEMWKKCDVIITLNERIIDNKPEGKVVVLINKDDNKNLQGKVDLHYDSLFDLISDTEFINKVRQIEGVKKTSFLQKIKKIFKK